MAWQAWFYQSGYLRAKKRTPKAMTSTVPGTVQVSRVAVSAVYDGTPDQPPASASAFKVGTAMPLGRGESLPAQLGASTWSPGTPDASGNPIAVSGPPVGVQVGPQAAVTPYYGDIVLANGHATYRNIDIYGRILGRCTTSQSDSTHVCVSNFIARGDAGDATSITACATGTSYNFGAAVFEWGSFDATGRTNFFKDCIDGGGYTARYCEMRGGVDGVGINTVGNVTIYCCRIWDGTWFAWYNSATGGTYAGSPAQKTRDTHNDGVQWQAGQNVTITGNWIGAVPYYNNTPIDSSGYSTVDPQTPEGAAIIAQVNQGVDFKNSGLIIQNSTGGAALIGSVTYNWVAGGGARINIGTPNNADKMAGVTVAHNKFFKTVIASPRIVSPGYEIYKISDCAATITDNTHVEDGTPVTVTSHS